MPVHTKLRRWTQRPSTLRPSTLRTALVGVGLLSLTLTACGSTQLPGGEPSSAASTGSSASASASASSKPITGTLDDALAAKVPAAIKQKGTLIDGSDASYAPNEFMDTDGKTIIGMDVDLMNAVATTLGLKVQYNNAGFDTIILGVTSGKYDIAVSSFTINDQRKKQVSMVQYFNAGTSWAAKPGSNLNPDDMCGKTVAVQKGTVQVDDIQARDKACTGAGKPKITIVVEGEQSKATADVISGKADAMLADSPVVAYAIGQTNGQLEQVGTMYDAAPYGIVVSKQNAEFAAVIGEALAKLKADGTYEAILSKWNNSDGAVAEFPVNP
ncbi:ABC transporter substrate-binding protein [Aestuariimicrobium kwangyangense]|uniref:ABC transporter substrate-binding protein n=1 Tax=Aestuariimicrobium kwangyangense TaxID=396389 RepID=UPI0003B46739|nr:ABC transporter substrate-binding protein [Aestuariimicrobium kwangyangense]